VLKRIYIDNYRCFVNFEVQLRPKQLIIGVNGAGKSAFLEVLRGLRDFVVARSKVDEVFTSETRTRWNTLSKQTFELEVVGNGGTYLYSLWIDVPDGEGKPCVLKEALEFEKKPLLLFQDDQVQVFDDNHTEKSSYSFESDRSAFTVLGPRKAGLKLAWFKEWIDKLYCARVNPALMGNEGNEAHYYLDDDLQNFAAWYGHVIQEKTSQFIALQKALGEVIDDFDSLEFKRIGRKARFLNAVFLQKGESTTSQKGRRIEFDFDELSDGQRALIALYALLYCAVETDTTICLDEPDNFLALAEIQPWLLELGDRIEEGAQAILISHHPEIIDLWAPECGLVFSRNGLGPVRASVYREDEFEGLTPSEVVARGWELE
jgi:AAA15 family ATPase/GTPase